MMEKLQNRYILQEELGSGGMASVWLAFDPILEREVAIKIISKQYAKEPGFLERFRREAAIAANLDHPGIAKVYEQGDDDGTPFLVMEYVKGPTLRQALSEEISLEESLQITREILEATGYAHAQGVLHRDIKPQNIILSDEGAKLIDFGVAQIAGASQLTTPGEIIGTAEYLAPEIAAGKGASEASDLYAVSAVLYEMITGKTPYPGKTIIEVVTKQTTSDPPLPSKLRQGLDPYFDHLLFRGLAKNPHDRFQSAQEFLLALDDKKTAKKSSLVFPLALAFLLLALSVLWLQGKQDRMPSFLGLDKKEAISKSEKIGIEPLFLYREKQKPKGLIFWQSKSSDQIINPGEQVLFYISKGPNKQLSLMPNLVGKNLESARDFLEKREIGIRINLQEGAEGIVLATNPKAGEPLASEITLIVGQMALPDVLGDNVDTAISLLQDLGISYSLAYEESSSPSGSIISQDPPAGTLTKSVNLLIAAPSKYATVPELLGFREYQVTPLLSESRFSALILYRESQETPGVVIDQDPEPGEEKRVGTTVRVWISQEAEDK